MKYYIGQKIKAKHSNNLPDGVDLLHDNINGKIGTIKNFLQDVSVNFTKPDFPLCTFEYEENLIKRTYQLYECEIFPISEIPDKLFEI